MERLRELRLSAVMRRDPESVTETATAREALELVSRTGADHLLVEDASGEELLGIVCRCDLERARPAQLVRRLMQAPPVTVHAAASLESAAALMRDRGVGCLPVVSGGLILGIVTRTDLAEAGLSSKELRPPCASCGSFHDVEATSDVDAPAFCADCRRCPNGDAELGVRD